MMRATNQIIMWDESRMLVPLSLSYLVNKLLSSVWTKYGVIQPGYLYREWHLKKQKSQTDQTNSMKYPRQHRFSKCMKYWVHFALTTKSVNLLSPLLFPCDMCASFAAYFVPQRLRLGMMNKIINRKTCRGRFTISHRTKRLNTQYLTQMLCMYFRLVSDSLYECQRVVCSGLGQ